MYDCLETQYLRLVRGEIQGFFPSLVRACLKILSGFYAIFVFFRNKAYEYRFFPTYTSSVPIVISIGNIAAGGTGKTPVTIMLAKEVSNKVLTAILTRGYRSKAEKYKSPLELNECNQKNYAPSICGDEPLLIAKSVPSAMVFVNKNRVKSAALAEEKGTKVLILDDGMQHRKLARNYEIVIIDANDPLAQGHLLPYGLLREKPTALKRADLIILNNLTNDKEYHTVSAQIKRFTNAPLLGTRAHLTIREISGTPIESICNKNIGMFCGIGNPKNFEKTLQNLGANIIHKMILKDHTKIELQQIKEFANTCKKLKADYIVCTEKDKIKLENTTKMPIPLIWTEVNLQVKEGIDYWKQFVKDVVGLANKAKNTETAAFTKM